MKQMRQLGIIPVRVIWNYNKTLRDPFFAKG